MKASTEALSPTRVKLTVEVPFDELKPSLDVAYKKLAGTVRVQGFRPGKVPPRILDQRVGRGTVLSEAMEDAVPRFYSAAITENEVDILGRPEVDITSFGDNEPLVFTAEVDVRPAVELPSYEGLPVVVDAAEPSDADIDEQLDSMRERFAVLTGVERAAATGDYVSIDLSAEADGVPIDDAATTGLSYEVGSEALIDGLDTQLVGMAEGESATFTSALLAGEQAGTPAQVTVTVRGVKTKELPAVDDEFATTASEFDTVAELKADLVTRMGRIKKLQQGMEARDKVLEVLLERTEVPLPAGAVDSEVEARMHNMSHQLENAGLSLEGYLTDEGKTREEFDAEVRASAEKAVKASLVLDAVAKAEQISVNDTELTDQVVRRAQRAGMDPQEYANALMQNNQVGVLAGEVVRGKALALVLESAVVTDTGGDPVDLKALADDGGVPAAEHGETGTGGDGPDTGGILAVEDEQAPPTG